MSISGDLRISRDAVKQDCFGKTGTDGHLQHTSTIRLRQSPLLRPKTWPLFAGVGNTKSPAVCTLSSYRAKLRRHQVSDAINFDFCHRRRTDNVWSPLSRAIRRGLGGRWLAGLYGPLGPS